MPPTKHNPEFSDIIQFNYLRQEIRVYRAIINSSIPLYNACRSIVFSDLTDKDIEVMNEKDIRLAIFHLMDKREDEKEELDGTDF